MSDGQVPESSEVRNERVFDWLDREGLRGNLSAGAKENYRRSGRGFWMASFRRAGATTNCQWVRGDDYQALIDKGQVPGGPEAADTARMLADYDPQEQFVLVVEAFDGKVDCYTVHCTSDDPGAT
jgi:hypothetical protein